MNQHVFIGGAEGMAVNGVNLDALIPREDFATDTDRPTGTLDATIGIHHLANSTFFVGGLRKPDFQRETANWTPQKILDLITAFLDGDLIPAIILWRSGNFSFVIDGAHRLSALLAWIYDDYGDRRRSLQFFGNQIPDEQTKLADQTRKLVEGKVGTFAMYEDALKNMFGAPEHLRKRLANLANNSFVAQWVPAVDADAAQKSFFKINQASTPIDPTEKRILKARQSALAIASRAISHGGTGHRYWSAFPHTQRQKIEALGKEIHDALYMPPLGSAPIKTSDVPVAGRGYSSLPFIFDLINVVTGSKIKDSTTSEDVKDHLNKDEDGTQTISFLQAVKKKVARITTTEPGSLGLHPLVYFYTRGGKFQPISFLAIVPVIDRLIDQGNLDRFIDVREKFENFLMNHKEAFTLIVKRQGSGARSQPAIENFIEKAIQEFWKGKNEKEVLDELAKDRRFSLLVTPQPVREGDNSSRDFSSSVKTAAFVSELTRNGAKCGICGTLVHRNSMHTDHKIEKSKGGSAHQRNAQITHPYCDSTYKRNREFR
jgi:hypothetical protein